LNAAIGQGVFSGASLLVSRGRTSVFERTWGTVESDGVPVAPSTRFDLASLTKPLVTANLCMAAIERGLFNLDDRLCRFFAGSVPRDKEGITVKNLLSHSSGLPPYAPFYLELVKLPPEARRNALAPMILRTPLDTAPGKAARYSDLGYMLLGLIVEKQMGDRLDRLARDYLFAPLGIDELHFCPTSPQSSDLSPRSSVLTYAATQLCPWRKRLLCGEVDDENAWALGGVAGHAGLFGTARGTFELLCSLWDIYEGQPGRGARFPSPPSQKIGRGLEASPAWPPGVAGDPQRSEGPPRRPLLPRDIVRLFWTRTETAQGLSDWCLGYDTPSRQGYSSAGHCFSANTIGHLGFTGVSFWLDLEKRVLVILLTNRVYPTRQNDAIRQLRPVLHDIIMNTVVSGQSSVAGKLLCDH